MKKGTGEDDNTTTTKSLPVDTASFKDFNTAQITSFILTSSLVTGGELQLYSSTLEGMQPQCRDCDLSKVNQFWEQNLQFLLIVGAY